MLEIFSAIFEIISLDEIDELRFSIEIRNDSLSFITFESNTASFTISSNSVLEVVCIGIILLIYLRVQGSSEIISLILLIISNPSIFVETVNIPDISVARNTGFSSPWSCKIFLNSSFDSSSKCLGQVTIRFKVFFESPLQKYYLS